MWSRTREGPKRCTMITHLKLFLHEEKELVGAISGATPHACARYKRCNLTVRSQRPAPVTPSTSLSTRFCRRVEPSLLPTNPTRLCSRERIHKSFRRAQVGLLERASHHCEERDQACTLPMEKECGCKTRVQPPRQAKEAVDRAEQDKLVETTIASTATIVQSSFHRRHLPRDCIAFSSPEGRQLFLEAMNSRTNYMHIYFPLAEQFITQAEPAFCGLSTLAMCLNALEIDPGRLWKGPWRWFSEELFDCCTSLSVAKEKGISMSEFICLARCNGVVTEDYRATTAFTLEQFRALIQRSCATSSEIVVLNYSRKVLGQTGDGHFSPVGGYHAERDMVLLMDVARFKYPPHWVHLSRVYDAMQRLDQSINLPRGLVILKKGAHATGPTLVKQQLIHCDETTAVLRTPAPQPCCYSSAAVEAARRMGDAAVAM
ncbi:hypothetical protein PsorP6_006966 [Peronosclerospora sorghi]|uniref:Uncharacterized protein n=1 Tax=Peronosclerospora sorghi TaxID=230839 RepID=A0ACC0WCM3_9STRA|nr:hypothetical protein PsorP6_006966 [Peronosclerospora sorghi]